MGTKKETMGELTKAQKENYMGHLGDMIGSVLPSDCTFLTVVMYPNPEPIPESKTLINYISSARRLEIPRLLRELANALEADMAEGN